MIKMLLITKNLATKTKVAKETKKTTAKVKAFSYMNKAKHSDDSEEETEKNTKRAFTLTFDKNKEEAFK